jgi:hypothetical protein
MLKFEDQNRERMNVDQNNGDRVIAHRYCDGYFWVLPAIVESKIVGGGKGSRRDGETLELETQRKWSTQREKREN